MVPILKAFVFISLLASSLSINFNDVCQGNKCFLWPGNPSPFNHLSTFVNADRIYCADNCVITIVPTLNNCTNYTVCSEAIKPDPLINECKIQGFIQVNYNMTITKNGLIIQGQDYKLGTLTCNQANAIALSTQPTVTIGIASPKSKAYLTPQPNWTCNLFIVNAINVQFRNINFYLDPNCYSSNLFPSIISYMPIVYQRGGTILLENLIGTQTNFGLVLFNQPLEPVKLTLNNLQNNLLPNAVDPKLKPFPANIVVNLIRVEGVISCTLVSSLFVLGGITLSALSPTCNFINASNFIPTDRSLLGCGPLTALSTSYCDGKEKTEQNLLTALIVLSSFFSVVFSLYVKKWWHQRKLTAENLPNKTK